MSIQTQKLTGDGILVLRVIESLQAARQLSFIVR
jgi:hypothetical protein